MHYHMTVKFRRNGEEMIDRWDIDTYDEVQDAIREYGNVVAIRVANVHTNHSCYKFKKYSGK